MGHLRLSIVALLSQLPYEMMFYVDCICCVCCEKNAGGKRTSTLLGSGRILYGKKKTHR